MTDPFLLHLAAAPARTIAVVLSALLLMLAGLPAPLLFVRQGWAGRSGAGVVRRSAPSLLRMWSRPVA
ncbi:hypothetical protein ACWEO1_40860, partial [Kitasatospora cineracea]